MGGSPQSENDAAAGRKRGAEGAIERSTGVRRLIVGGISCH
jgi:hypothetical protein